MKKIIDIAVGLFAPVLLFSQSRIVFNAANIIITNGANFVVQNPSPDALTVLSSGGIINEGATAKVIWNIGTNNASYVVPFISNGNSIPVSFTTSGAVGNGLFTLGTYAGPDWKNSDYLPPTVTNVNRNGTDNSDHVIDRFWQIQTSGYTTNPSLSDFVFSYNENEWNETGNNINESSLVAQSWNSTSNAWAIPAVSTDNASANTVTVSTINSPDLNAWWTLVDQAYALPLTLLNFTAEKQNTNALLKWTVSKQINVSYYEVQRSINGIDFYAVGKVNAINSANLNEDYSFTDVLYNINANAIYYRLRMVDIDGKFTYSPVRFISLNDDENKTIQVFPNPVSNIFIMRFGKGMQGNYIVTITDASGRQVVNKEINVIPNSTFYFNRRRAMAAGTYFMLVKGNNIKQMFTIVFQ